MLLPFAAEARQTRSDLPIESHPNNDVHSARVARLHLLCAGDVFDLYWNQMDAQRQRNREATAESHRQGPSRTSRLSQSASRKRSRRVDACPEPRLSHSPLQPYRQPSCHRTTPPCLRNRAGDQRACRGGRSARLSRPADAESLHAPLPRTKKPMTAARISVTTAKPSVAVSI